MRESPLIIRMNIAHYQAMLQLNMNAEKRTMIERLLTEAESALVQPPDLEPEKIWQKPASGEPNTSELSDAMDQLAKYDRDRAGRFRYGGRPIAPA